MPTPTLPRACVSQRTALTRPEVKGHRPRCEYTHRTSSTPRTLTPNPRRTPTARAIIAVAQFSLTIELMKCVLTLRHHHPSSPSTPAGPTSSARPLPRAASAAPANPHARPSERRPCRSRHPAASWAQPRPRDPRPNSQPTTNTSRRRDGRTASYPRTKSRPPRIVCSTIRSSVTRGSTSARTARSRVPDSAAKHQPKTNATPDSTTSPRTPRRGWLRKARDANRRRCPPPVRSCSAWIPCPGSWYRTAWNLRRRSARRSTQPCASSSTRLPRRFGFRRKSSDSTSTCRISPTRNARSSGCRNTAWNPSARTRPRSWRWPKRRRSARRTRRTRRRLCSESSRNFSARKTRNSKRGGKNQPPSSTTRCAPSSPSSSRTPRSWNTRKRLSAKSPSPNLKRSKRR